MKKFQTIMQKLIFIEERHETVRFFSLTQEAACAAVEIRNQKRVS